MIQPDPDKTKLLFLLSNDYGELFDAMCFVQGTGLEATFAMPPRLFSVNRADFPYPASPYSSESDIREVIAQTRPSRVLLFSGYLYVINGNLELESLERLLRSWRDQNLNVATSDPFLGLMSAVGNSTFNERHPMYRWLMSHFSQISRLLQDYVHIYHGAPGMQTGNQVSFFSRHIILQPSQREQSRRKLFEWSRIDEAKRRWLCILSTEDYAAQLTKYGAERFLELLSRRLQDAVRYGRQPVLLAPQPCVAAIEARMKGIGDLVALSACSYTLFMLLLHDAEYVFYWNVFSASIIGRAVNRLPLFFFDRGHLTDALRPFFAEAMRHFYAGCQIELLELAEPLAPERLAPLATRQEEGIFLPGTKNCAGCLSPEEVMRRLVGVPSA